MGQTILGQSNGARGARLHALFISEVICNHGTCHAGADGVESVSPLLFAAENLSGMPDYSSTERSTEIDQRNHSGVAIGHNYYTERMTTAKVH